MTAKMIALMQTGGFVTTVAVEIDGKVIAEIHGPRCVSIAGLVIKEQNARETFTDKKDGAISFQNPSRSALMDIASHNMIAGGSKKERAKIKEDLKDLPELFFD